MDANGAAPRAVRTTAGTRLDGDGWSRLLARYSRLVYSVPRRYGLREPDCDDVFQATWLTAVAGDGPPQGDENVVRWIASIAFWKTRDLLRRRRIELRTPAAMVELGGTDDAVPEAALEAAETQQVVHDALAVLRPRDREILESLFLREEPLSYGEVARRLRVAAGSVGALRQRAIGRLRAELGRRGF